MLALYPACFDRAYPRSLDGGMKINIVDDENKILDTGPTAKALTLSPTRTSFSRKPMGFVQRTRGPSMSSLMAASASFISSGNALSASPNAHRRYPSSPRRCLPPLQVHVRQNRYQFVDLSTVRPWSNVSDQAIGLEYVQSTLPFINRHIDTYRHEFN